MDNPAQSLFQGADIKINNSQNNEEEEDIEDQKRRKEELQNLLTAALDDFNYDESTVNSSTNISTISLDDIHHKYKEASGPNEQLKVLYDVRIRELTALRKEYSDFRSQAEKDSEITKKKLLLSEAEIRQLKLSLKNSEDILVEKTSTINELKDILNSKEVQLKDYEKAIENYQIEIGTYETTLSELQMKLADPGPFCTSAKRFNSEEIKKAHQEQVIRLETLLEEQTKIATILEKEKILLQQDLKNLITQKRKAEDEDSAAIKALTKTLEDAQNQCKNLLDIVELLTKENHHLQDRLGQSNVNDFENKIHQEPLEYNVLLVHTEKLKKMLLDKSVQIDTLNSKLKNYENDIRELVEYRQLKCDIYKKEFQHCENKEHIKSLIVMQNDIQNYKRIIEDKNEQILTLNSTNRDLQEKIEEMLLQTRNEIQNLSHKYSLPQLEQMTVELKNAEDRAKELQDKLDKSEERRLSLVQKLQKNDQKLDKDTKKELDAHISHIRNMENDKHNLENKVKTLQNDLEVAFSEIKNLKQYSDELIKENAELKLKLKQAQAKTDSINSVSQDLHERDTVKREYEDLKQQLNQVMAHLQKNKPPSDIPEKVTPEIVVSLKSDIDEFLHSLNKNESLIVGDRVKQWKNQLDKIKIQRCPEDIRATEAQLEEALQNLQEARSKVKSLEDALEDLTSSKTIAEGERCSYQFKIRDCETQLEHAFKTIKFLENEIDGLKLQLKNNEENSQLRQSDELMGELCKVNEELIFKENLLKICEEDKRQLNDLLHKTNLQLEEVKKEVLILQGKLNDMNDRAVRRNLEKELKETENLLEQSKVEEGNACDSEYFKQCLQAEILKSELKLREELQFEYLKKMRDIERKYRKACSATNELYEDQVEKMKNQESRFREHLAKILAECSQKIHEFETENKKLIDQINYVQAEYVEFKNRTLNIEDNYKKIIKQVNSNAEQKVEEWKVWSKQFITNCLKIETVNKKSRDKILIGMKNVDSEIALIEKAYKEKVKKYLKSDKS